MELQNKVAVITGGGSGIGRATAMALAHRGVNVLVTDIDAARADAVAGEIGQRAISARCDVTSVDDLSSIRQMALDTFGRFDIVMNNVGVLVVGDPLDIPLDAWQRVIDINLLSVVRSNEVFLPALIAQGSGHVVNTASTAGLLPYGFDRLPYTATKHAIVGLSESLAIYLRPHGVGVSCLCPAGVITNILEQITFYGEPSTPRGPQLPIVEAEAVGALVADGIAEDRFLLVTAPEVFDELRDRAADVDGYISRAAAEV